MCADPVPDPDWYSIYHTCSLSVYACVGQVSVRLQEAQKHPDPDPQHWYSEYHRCSLSVYVLYVCGR